ncbi:MAG TPA: hypothetical protein VJ570_12120 [Holophagaceae bacterium]|nr:hypothetical protein [Holophagaceae bacterium]
MIHHVSIPALDPESAARTIARLTGWEALPFPIFPGCMLVMAEDGHGTGMEIYPADARMIPGPAGVVELDRGGVPATGGAFHVNLSVAATAEDILAIAESAGWPARISPRGPFYKVVEVWVEGHTLLEVLPAEQRQAYESFTTPANWKANFGEAR